MKRFLILLTALCGMTAGAQAQKLIVGAGFETYFDNREYVGNEFDTSKTLFSARLTPRIGVQWGGRNRLVFAVDMLQNFGDNEKFLSEVRPLMYYRYRTDRVKALAGIFERNELKMNAYPLAMMGDEMRFYDNRIQGFMGRYTSARREDSFVEMSFDWCGMQSETSRERFRIMSAGRYTADWFRFGYALSVFHFAQTTEGGGVSDNTMVYPYVGARFNAYFDFDIEFGAIAAPQRIREFDEGWKAPAGGQLTVSMSRWGVKLENILYCGDGIMPYYNLYGSEFYVGERFWSTTKGVYNRTKIGYEHSFFDDTLSVEAFLLVHYDGTGTGTSQQIKLSVDLEKMFGKGKNRHHKE